MGGDLSKCYKCDSTPISEHMRTLPIFHVSVANASNATKGPLIVDTAEVHSSCQTARPPARQGSTLQWPDKPYLLALVNAKIPLVSF